MLFRPNAIPDNDKYVQWSNEIVLQLISNILFGPFNFETRSSSNRTRNKVSGTHFRNLHYACIQEGLLPPTP